MGRLQFTIQASHLLSLESPTRAGLAYYSGCGCGSTAGASQKTTGRTASGFDPIWCAGHKVHGVCLDVLVCVVFGIGGTLFLALGRLLVGREIQGAIWKWFAAIHIVFATLEAVIEYERAKIR